MQEIATVSKGAASLHGHVPSHLPHPLLVRVNGDPGDVHLAALKMDVGQFDYGTGDNGLNRPALGAYSADADKMPKVLNCGQIIRLRLGNYWRPLR